MGGKSILYDQNPKLGEQSRIIYAVATIFIFERFILGVTIFCVEKTLQY